EFVILSDTVSDVEKEWGKDANALFNELIPAKMNMDLSHFDIDLEIKKQIEKHAPIILKMWLSATCPSWKPLKTTELTVFQLESDSMT
ncbi:hypothetical protein PMAYCL1PPCAC_10287, partial [Pristionchus mayeri]